MRSAIRALPIALLTLLPGSLLAQYRTSHLQPYTSSPPTVSMPPRSPSYADSLRVQEPAEPTQRVYLSPSGVARLQTFADRMQGGYRDSFNRMMDKNHEQRDYYVADVVSRTGVDWPKRDREVIREYAKPREYDLYMSPSEMPRYQNELRPARPEDFRRLRLSDR